MVSGGKPVQEERATVQEEDRRARPFIGKIQTPRGTDVSSQTGSAEDDPAGYSSGCGVRVRDRAEPSGEGWLLGATSPVSPFGWRQSDRWPERRPESGRRNGSGEASASTPLWKKREDESHLRVVMLGFHT